MQWQHEFIKPRKAVNNLEAGSENNDSEIDPISGEDSITGLQLPSGNKNLQEPFDDEGFSDNEEQTKIKRDVKRPKTT